MLVSKVTLEDAYLTLHRWKLESSSIYWAEWILIWLWDQTKAIQCLQQRFSVQTMWWHSPTPTSLPCDRHSSANIPPAKQFHSLCHFGFSAQKWNCCPFKAYCLEPDTILMVNLCTYWVSMCHSILDYCMINL